MTFRTQERVARVLEWLALPEAKRPSFLTLYFSDVDTAGHRHGPDSLEVRAAALKADSSVGALVAGVEKLGLASRVQLRDRERSRDGRGQPEATGSPR